MKTITRNTVVISIVAFVLQMIWEYAQCSYLYELNDLTGHTRLMLSATVGDTNMSIILYWILIFINKNVNWIVEKWHRHDYIITTLYALFLSFYFEIHALYTNRWGYNPETMPLFPGTPVAFVPVMQLLVLFPVIFLISRKILRWVSSKNHV